MTNSKQIIDPKFISRMKMRGFNSIGVMEAISSIQNNSMLIEKNIPAAVSKKNICRIDEYIKTDKEKRPASDKKIEWQQSHVSCG